MKYSSLTLRVRIIGLVCGVILITTLAILFMVKYRIESSFLQSHDTYSKNLVNYLKLSVANQYKSIQFHKQSVLAIRKNVLKEQTEIVLSILNKYNHLSKQGVLSIREAQKEAAHDISLIRYGDDVGYFWINDIQRPYPTMIMHPTLPELDGTVLDDEKFNCALGKNENLFKAFVDVCLEHKEGYVDYLWPKPSEEGLTEDQPKLSYVTVFEPWNWIIGTGVYIDDIDSAVNKRIEAVVKELNESVLSIANNDEDYVFIFTDDKKLLVHPYLKSHEILDINNSLTGNTFFEDFRLAKEENKDYIDYNWLRINDTVNFTYKKRAYYSYFEPLKWYIASAYYADSITNPINKLVTQIALFVVLLLLMAFIVSVVLANSVTKPIYELSKLVVKIEKEGIPHNLKPIKGSVEIVKFSQLLGTMITSLNTAQQELIENKEKLRTYVQYAPDPVFVINANGNIINVNKQATKLLNMEEFELQLSNFANMVHESEIDDFLELLHKIKRKNEAERELTIKTSEKYTIHTIFSGALLKSGEIICFVKDISQLKQYQKDLYEAKQKAEESNRLKSAFLANMSHEIRTPMNGVVGFSQLISDPDLSNDERMQYSQIISKSTMQLLDVVNDIIDISRIETGQVKINESALVVKEFLNDIYMVYEPIANLKGIELKLDIENIGKGKVIGDSTKLRQIINNLLNNAIKFTDKGSVTLGCSFDKHVGKFYVKDTGVGLSEEDVKIIFDRFTQADSNSDRGGTGLGLSISKAFVELMNGEFWVESELNVGTAFYFKIPFKKPDQV